MCVFVLIIIPCVIVMNDTQEIRLCDLDWFFNAVVLGLASEFLGFRNGKYILQI